MLLSLKTNEQLPSEDLLIVPGLRIHYFKSENAIYIRYVYVRMIIEVS